MAEVNKLIQILNRREFGGSGKNTDKKSDDGSKKIKGTGLVLYAGGKQKTPTGRSNAFSESGLNEKDILEYAKKYNLPTTSNKEFQKAQYDLLNSTPQGRLALAKMEEEFGKPKSGSYVDGMLGARTMKMMMATPSNKPEDIVKIERQYNIPTLPIPNISKDYTELPTKLDINSWQDERLTEEQRKRIFDETLNEEIKKGYDKRRREKEYEIFMKTGSFPEKNYIADDWYAPGGMLSWKDGQAPKWYNFRRKAMAKKNIEQFKRNINQGKNWYDAQDL